MELVRELVAQHYPETAVCFRGLDRASWKDTFLRQIQAKACPKQLLWLAYNNCVDQLDAILACPHPNIQVNWALHGATQAKNEKLVRHLMKDPRANITADLVVEAVQQGCIPILDYLIANEAPVPSNDAELAELRQIAASHGQLEMLKQLLFDDPADTQLVDSAALAGQQDVQMQLVNRTPDVQVGNATFRSACLGQNQGILDDLLNRPNIDPSEYNNQAVREALKAHRPDIVLRILQHPLPLRRKFLYQKIWKQLSANDNEASAALRDQMIDVAA